MHIKSSASPAAGLITLYKTGLRVFLQKTRSVFEQQSFVVQAKTYNLFLLCSIKIGRNQWLRSVQILEAKSFYDLGTLQLMH